MAFRWPQHNLNNPQAVDYSVVWRRWLNGRTIVSVNWQINTSSGIVSFNPITEVDNLTCAGVTNTPTVATIYLTGGNNNIDYKIYCTIVPSDGASETRIIQIRAKAS